MMLLCVLQVLQNLGKADKTKDDELDQNLELFNEQQLSFFVCCVKRKHCDVENI